MDPQATAKRAGELRCGVLSPDVPALEVADAVRILADALARPGTIPASDVRLAASALNKRRLFGDTRVLGEAWRAVQDFDPTIAKHYAQALINLSALDEAERVLQEGLAVVEAPGAGGQALVEVPEYHGLLGRVAKQRFVATGDRDRLAEAIERYWRQYDTNPAKPYWHGINVVALRSWQERNDGVVGAGPPVREIAQAIYDQVERLHRTKPDDPWPCATASEAALALDDCTPAELWLYRFLHHPNARPFDLDSYDRQLREIWQGDIARSATCADRLATILSRHLQSTQAQWTVASAAVRDLARELEQNSAGLEKNFSGAGTFTVEMIGRMLESCSSIGCVGNSTGARLGTGFLVAGDWLDPRWGSAPVFVTNAHVISDTEPKAIPSAQALVSFEVESASAARPVFYPVGEVLFSSPPGDVGVPCEARERLDVTIVRLRGLRDGCTGLKAAPRLPLIDARTRAYVVGHPLGGGLQIALHDSALLDYDDVRRLVHYRTPSDPGSSGSPVFNEQWDVIALHHAGSAKTPRLHGEGFYEANEGIALSAIRAAVAAR